MSMACFADENSIKNPQEIVDIFVRRNQEALEGKSK